MLLASSLKSEIMKRFLFICIVASITSCGNAGNNTNTTIKDSVVTDSGSNSLRTTPPDTIKSPENLNRADTVKNSN